MTRGAAATLVGCAILVYAAANLAHEGLGHGVACVLAGGKPLQFNAVFFECDEAGVGPGAARLISAAGTLVNLLLGLGAAAALRLARLPGTLRYALWLLMTVSLLQGTGYWFFSGVAGIGDWKVVVAGLPAPLLWRLLLALAGGAGYWLTIVASLRALARFAEASQARRLTVVPYVVGAMLYIAAGLFNPYGLKLVLVSAAAASLGGTSALAWMASLPFPPSGGRRLELGPGVVWGLAGLVAAAIFVVVMGPGLVFKS